MRLSFGYLFLLLSPPSYATDLGYTPALADEVSADFVIFPPSGGAPADTRPYLILPPDAWQSDFIVAPMPENTVTTRQPDQSLKTKQLKPIIK